MKPTTRSRYFSFTDFQLSDKSAIFNKHSDDIRAIAWSLEVCPSTGREHHQGYLQLYTASRFAKVKKILGDKVHVEAMRGSVLDNEVYCEKAGGLTKMGEFTKQGKRTDIDDIKAMLSNGATMDEVMEKAPALYLKYHAGLDKMKAMYDTKNRGGNRAVEVTVLVGSAGTGKTRHVVDYHPDVFIVDSSAPDNFPFNGYNGERVILIDDFNGWLKYTYLLRVLDIYKLALNIKGGRTMAAWEKVYITTNVRPTYWYDSLLTENLQRRINKIYEVTIDNGTIGHLTERDKRWAFDRVGNTDYEGNTY